jgi:hypothetical protein
MYNDCLFTAASKMGLQSDSHSQYCQKIQSKTSFIRLSKHTFNSNFDSIDMNISLKTCFSPNN